jgi:HK97 family phage prohead protease
VNLNRLFRAELSLGGDGRTLTGYAVPFDTDAEVDDRDGRGPYVERFARGAFRNVVRAPHVVELRYRHDDDLIAWVGRTTLLREESRGLWSEFRLDDPERNPRAGLVAYKIESGQLPALSVSFVPGRTTQENRGRTLVRTRHTVKMIDHIAVVPEGAYPMLEPLALRHAPEPRESSVERWREWRNGLIVPD